MTRQYPLPLPHDEALEADDFMVTDSNREAAAWLERWPAWPAHCLVIFGPAGAGKTHLANVWSARARAVFLTQEELAKKDLGVFFAGKSAVVIDDAEKAVGTDEAERGFFHLYNLLRETKGFLLLTSRQPPAQWKVKLPDLRSRLLASQAVTLGAPDDALLSALLLKQLDDRQLKVGTDVVDFLLPRLTRTPDAIRTLVNALDRASLAESRRITVALAKKVLEARS